MSSADIVCKLLKMSEGSVKLWRGSRDAAWQMHNSQRSNWCQVMQTQNSHSCSSSSADHAQWNTALLPAQWTSYFIVSQRKKSLQCCSYNTEITPCYTSKYDRSEQFVTQVITRYKKGHSEPLFYTSKCWATAYSKIISHFLIFRMLLDLPLTTDTICS